MATGRRARSATPVTDEQILEIQNPEAERAVLGEMLDSTESLTRACALLQPDHFQSPAHRTVFETLLSLRKKGAPSDAVILKNELACAGVLEEIGGQAFVSGLVGAPAGHAGLEHYAVILRDLANRRALLKSALELAHTCTNGHSIAELREAAASLYREALAADPETRQRCKSIDALLDDYAEAVSVQKGRKLRTGLWSLDEAMDGIRAGEVLTVVARPQVGKSALAGQIVVNCALEGILSVIFSLEMPREQAFERLLQALWNLARGEVEALGRRGFAGVTPTQRAELESLRRNVVIVDRGKSGIADLDASMTEAAATLGKAPRLSVIDYLGLLGSGAKNLPLYQRISEAAVDVKSFAKRHAVSVLLLSQAGRDQDPGRSGGWREIGLDSARDSGQVEEACDFLVTLWRPELEPGLPADALADVRGDLEGRLVKNRRGPRPALHLRLDEARQRITDPATEDTP